MNSETLIRLAQKYLKKDFSDVEVIDSPCVMAKREAGKTYAGGSSIPQKMRALSLIGLQNQKKEFEIVQKPAFERLGCMLDMSRGGVMRVSKLKSLLQK